MKQSETSDTTNLTDDAIPGRRKRSHRLQSRVFRLSKWIKVVFAFLFMALGVTVYVLAHRSFSNRTANANVASPLTGEVIEVEVLDGTGSMKATQHMTNVLRLLGYDVVEMKRNNDGIVDRSYVLDRSGNLDAARKLAASIGIPEDKVFQKISRNLYLDITVIVGKDHPQLKAFQISGERSRR